MTLTLRPPLVDAGINPPSVLVIRHACARKHETTSLQCLHAGSMHVEILEYARNQSSDT